MMYKKPIIKKNKGLFLSLISFGLVVILGGYLSERYLLSNERLLEFASGIGCAIIALSFVGLVSLERSPEQVKLQKINENDERHIKIREKSAYSMFYVTMIGLSISELTFVWMDYIIPCVIIIALMAVHVFGYFVSLHLNSKRL